MYRDARFDQDGFCQPSKDVTHAQTAKTPERLVWDVCETLSATISTAYDAAIEVKGFDGDA